MQGIYLSPELQSTIQIGQRILLSFSCFCNLIAFICLIKETPENQSKFRYYLCYIQILVVINDVNLGILFQAFPLFPVFGAYCDGIMCRLGVPIRYSFALTIAIIGNIGASIIICFFYRHQSLVKVRFTEKSIKMLRSFVILVYNFPGIVAFSVEFDDSQTDYFIDNVSRLPKLVFIVLLQRTFGDLNWIRQRGLYRIFTKTPSVMAVPMVALAALFIALTVLVLMIWQIASNISEENKKAAKRNKRALHVLIFQLVVPVLLLIIPASIMMLSILFENLFSYEVCFISYHVLTLHTTTHSVTLVMITPAYRRFIRNSLLSLLQLKFLKRGRIQSVSVAYNVDYYRRSPEQ